MPDNLGGMNTDIGQLHYILHQSGIALDRLMGDELLQDMLSMASNYIDKGQRMNVVLAQLEEIFGRKLPRAVVAQPAQANQQAEKMAAVAQPAHAPVNQQAAKQSSNQQAASNSKKASKRPAASLPGDPKKVRFADQAPAAGPSGTRSQNPLPKNNVVTQPAQVPVSQQAGKTILKTGKKAGKRPAANLPVDPKVVRFVDQPPVAGPSRAQVIVVAPVNQQASKNVKIASKGPADLKNVQFVNQPPVAGPSTAAQVILLAQAPANQQFIVVAPANHQGSNNVKVAIPRPADPRNVQFADQPVVAGPSGAQAQLETKQTAPDPREGIALQISDQLRQSVHNINPIYAAFKAAELALTSNPLDELQKLFERLQNRVERVVTSDTKWQPPSFLNANHFTIFESVKAKFIQTKTEFLVSSLPHVQPAYLEKIAQDLNGNDLRIQGFIVEVCEGNRVVPLISEENKQYKDIVEDFFTVEKFLEIYEDPLSHFKNDSRLTDEKYRNQAVDQLKQDFRYASMTVLRKAFRENNYHYTPAFLQLNQESKKFKDRKTKRSDNECFGDKATDEFLLQEIAFMRIREDIEAYFKNKERIRLDAVEAARARGSLMECPICCEEELIELDMVRCETGHAICRQCVRKQSEEQIGLMKNHVFCLASNCRKEYSLRDLKSVLTKTCFKHLEKRRQAEEIMEAGIEGLESCPFCEYCEVPPENTFVFNCKKPDCMKASCRKCREPSHGQLTCQENAMKQKLANYVEIKMTEALVRQCPSCRKKFIKIDGCNKMRCVCGTVSCYICRAQIVDYDHFNRNANLPRNQQSAEDLSKCPLWSDTNKMHEGDVAKGAAEAKAELARQNPNLRVDLVLNKLV